MASVSPGSWRLMQHYLKVGHESRAGRLRATRGQSRHAEGLQRATCSIPTCVGSRHGVWASGRLPGHGLGLL